MEKCSLTLISMIKNEKSVIETFCGHAIDLFDRIVLVDHRSTDGTAEFIQQLADRFPQVEFFIFDEAGYFQSELMTWLVRNVVDRETSGWVFFLDADEFLPFETREEFDRELLAYSSFPVISLPWLNLVPLEMGSGQIAGGRFLKPPTRSRNCKIAFQPNRIPLDEVLVAQGNHELLIDVLPVRAFPAEEAFSLYHLPIRTKKQLREKILQGVASYKSMGKMRARDIGFHWDQIHGIMETQGVTNELKEACERRRKKR
ncbi:MAG: glycosyltransferase family 2 protein [Pirellulales bacterium]